MLSKKLIFVIFILKLFSVDVSMHPALQLSWHFLYTFSSFVPFGSLVAFFDGVQLCCLAFYRFLHIS